MIYNVAINLELLYNWQVTFKYSSKEVNTWCSAWDGQVK